MKLESGVLQRKFLRKNQLLVLRLVLLNRSHKLVLVTKLHCTVLTIEDVHGDGGLGVPHAAGVVPCVELVCSGDEQPADGAILQQVGLDAGTKTHEIRDNHKKEETRNKRFKFSDINCK